MEDFDLDKWRAERPMDYLKAIQLIIDAPIEDKPDVFMTIFQIAKLCIPDTLYKFYSLNGNNSLNKSKLDTLRKQQVYLAEIKTLNDPFDSKTLFYEPERLMKFKQLEHSAGRIFDNILASVRIACFTECTNKNLSMWANYSNNHSGYCVSYDMTSANPLLRGLTFPVQYSDRRHNYTAFLEDQISAILAKVENHDPKLGGIISLDDQSLPLVFSLADFIKGKDWEHEKEFRCSVHIDSKYKDLITAIPKEIFIGLNCPDNYKKELLRIGESLSIPTYKMQYDDTVDTFCLVGIRII